MAFEVVWTKQALQDREQVLKFWIMKNRSNTFSQKLNNEIKTSLQLLKKFPFMGRKTEIENVRVKIVKFYLIVYEVIGNTIYVLKFLDYRREPTQLPQ